METFAQASAYVPRPGFWRIREDAGQVYFESSLDGVAWDIEIQTATPFSVTSVAVSFGVETSGPMGGGVGVQFPAYNP